VKYKKLAYMNNKKRSVYIFSALGFVVLIAVVAQIGWGRYGRLENLKVIDFRSLLPSEISGWVVKDLPIADTPEMMEAVNSILNYDAYVYKSYTQADVTINVYVAYWMPARVHPELVEAHTPDVCWVANGWKMSVLPSLGKVEVEGGRVIPLNYYRRFEIGGANENYVLFWQVSGHDIRAMTSTDVELLPPLTRAKRRIMQVIDTITSPPGQQLFVRISANKPLEELLDDKPFKAVFQMTGRLLGGENLYVPKK
jgi:hypothetical protein